MCEIECPMVLVIGDCAVGKSSVIRAVMSGCVKFPDTSVDAECNSLIQHTNNATSFIEINPSLIKEDEIDRSHQLCHLERTADAVWIVIDGQRPLSAIECHWVKHYLKQAKRVVVVVTHMDCLRSDEAKTCAEEAVRENLSDFDFTSKGCLLSADIYMVDATGPCDNLVKCYSELCAAKRNEQDERRKASLCSEYQKYVKSGLLSFDFRRYRDSITYYCMGDHGVKAEEEYYQNCKPPFPLTDRFKERIRKVLQMPPPSSAVCEEFCDLREMAANGCDLIRAIEHGFPYWRDNAVDEEISSKAKFVLDKLEAFDCKMGVAENRPSVAEDVIAVLEYASKQISRCSRPEVSGSAGGIKTVTPQTVFVSYSTHDNSKIVADALVHYLESNGIRCWYAPRDIATGEAYAVAIERAISKAQCFVLVFSAASDKSKYCMKELNLAVDREKLILPFRIEDRKPTGGMSFYLSNLHWIDAFPSPEKCFGSLLKRLNHKGVTVKVRTEKELGEALKNNQDRIEIEGDLSKKVIKIKTTGKEAWAVACGAIAVAVIAVLASPATGGVSNVAHFAVAPVAAATLGVSVAGSAIVIAVAAGGIGALNKLRGYSLEENADGSITLKK